MPANQVNLGIGFYGRYEIFSKTPFSQLRRITVPTLSQTQNAQNLVVLLSRVG